MPIVTTLHTVLPTPTATQRDVMRKIVAKSTKIIVMAEKGRELLRCNVRGQAQWTLNRTFPIAEFLVREDFRLFGLLECQEQVGDLASMRLSA